MIWERQIQGGCSKSKHSIHTAPAFKENRESSKNEEEGIALSWGGREIRGRGGDLKNWIKGSCIRNLACVLLEAMSLYEINTVLSFQ